MIVFGGLNGDATPATRGTYWIVGIFFGAVTTAMWYAWHGRVTGLRTKVGLGLLAWVGAAVGLIVASTVALQWLLVNPLNLTVRGTIGLLVIAIGLLVLPGIILLASAPIAFVIDIRQ